MMRNDRFSISGAAFFFLRRPQIRFMQYLGCIFLCVDVALDFHNIFNLAHN